MTSELNESFISKSVLDIRGCLLPEISRHPAVDQQHEAQPRCPDRDMARRRLKSTAHRMRPTRFQVRGVSAPTK